MSYVNCATCATYINTREQSLRPALEGHIAKSGETRGEIFDRFMGGVHDRHLSGLSLDVSK